MLPLSGVSGEGVPVMLAALFDVLAEERAREGEKGGSGFAPANLVASTAAEARARRALAPSGKNISFSVRRTCDNIQMACGESDGKDQDHF